MRTDLSLLLHFKHLDTRLHISVIGGRKKITPDISLTAEGGTQCVYRSQSKMMPSEQKLKMSTWELF